MPARMTADRPRMGRPGGGAAGTAGIRPAERSPGWQGSAPVVPAGFQPTADCWAEAKLKSRPSRDGADDFGLKVIGALLANAQLRTGGIPPARLSADGLRVGNKLSGILRCSCRHIRQANTRIVWIGFLCQRPRRRDCQNQAEDTDITQAGSEEAARATRKSPRPRPNAARSSEKIGPAPFPPAESGMGTKRGYRQARISAPLFRSGRRSLPSLPRFLNRC